MWSNIYREKVNVKLLKGGLKNYYHRLKIAFIIESRCFYLQGLGKALLKEKELLF